MDIFSLYGVSKYAVETAQIINKAHKANITIPIQKCAFLFIIPIILLSTYKPQFESGQDGFV